MFDICSENEITDRGILVTPNKITMNYSYSSNLNCDVSIKSRNVNTGSIKLHFRSFDTEAEDGACYDLLTINGTEYCGVYTGLDLCFVTPSLELSFESDDYAGSIDYYTGFEIEFYTSQDNLCECLTESVDGNSAQACVFPFTYDGVTYHQCAGNVQLGKKPFCAVEVNNAGSLFTHSLQTS